MENVYTPAFPDAKILNVKFTLSSEEETRLYSVSDCSISYPSQLLNPFLGLPVESGKCESCGTSEPGECEGHFGYIQLPTPIFHPHHVSEIKRILGMICLNCLKIKKKTEKATSASRLSKMSGVPSLCSKCQTPPILIRETKNIDGALSLELRFAKRKDYAGCWSFLDRYGYCSPDGTSRSLLPYEVIQILERLPQETLNALAKKGCFPQRGVVMKCLSVPPNCLCVPDLPDAMSSISSDPTISMLKKILAKADTIKKSRSGLINFESHEIESIDLQAACAQYMQKRGAARAPKTVERKVRASVEANVYAKAWLEKMRSLFIRKGSGFSSRSVITGDAYQGINEIGLPLEIATGITFEERVTSTNRNRMQSFVDKGLCMLYNDGRCKYTMKESLKTRQSLKIGQVISRRIMDGDLVFVNRPPSTHKHSLQALSVYVHNDKVVKINPLICGALGADFDGDCIHIFYPQSLAAKAEVQELFAIEHQLLSSHSGTLNIQLVHDSILAAKFIHGTCLLDKSHAQQLMMWAPAALAEPAIIKAGKYGQFWTSYQILQAALPEMLNCDGQRYKICNSEILEFEVNRSQLHTILSDIFTSIVVAKGPREVIKVFNMLQPMLMEILFSNGCSVGLNDFYIPETILDDMKMHLQDLTPLLHFMRSTTNELVASQIEGFLQEVKRPIVQFVSKASTLGILIDLNSDQSLNKVIQQLGFVGLQLHSRGKYYSNELVDLLIGHSQQKYIRGNHYSAESLGLVRSCFFNGLDPFEDLLHSVASREGIVRSSRGLTEPGLLFKNLMAVLRDVTICYDGTVRNMCTNSIVQFMYSSRVGTVLEIPSCAGEPVGVLAATAISNPAYKAVLESSPSNMSSWDNMKEILFCKSTSKNDAIDRRVIIYLNECNCGRTYCKEKTAIIVQNHLQRTTLKDLGTEMFIEFQNEVNLPHCSGTVPGLIGHIHLDKKRLDKAGCSIYEILHECKRVLEKFEKKKHPLHNFYKTISLDACYELLCECKRVVEQYEKERRPLNNCCTKLSESPSQRGPRLHSISLHGCTQKESERCGCNLSSSSSRPPCLRFSYKDKNGALYAGCVEKTLKMLSEAIFPALLQTVVHGDPRVDAVDIFWVNSGAIPWVKNPLRPHQGELALEVTIRKEDVKNKGDAWRVAMDACLPIIPLIDTARCIPYAIQKIQEHLGIYSAFEILVQRLSCSMQNVAKGILKEHLIMVGSSMSCTGNIVGFNTAGYKALFRSFEVPVPFTEATLYAPMKCFERAAERCHSDSLMGVVASCSWGKHVAVGTGASFDIKWSDNKVHLPQSEYADTYAFLQLVREKTSDKEMSTLCLGSDIDDLDADEERMDICASPENHSNVEKLSFDDNIEDALDKNHGSQEENDGKLCWSTGGKQPEESNGWGNWNTATQTGVGKDELAANSSWTGWKSRDDQTSDVDQPVEASGWPGSREWASETQADKGNDEHVTTSLCSGWKSGNDQTSHVGQPEEASGWAGSREWSTGTRQTGTRNYERPTTSLCSGWESKKNEQSSHINQPEASDWSRSGTGGNMTVNHHKTDGLVDKHDMNPWNQNEVHNPPGDSWGRWNSNEQVEKVQSWIGTATMQTNMDQGEDASDKSGWKSWTATKMPQTEAQIGAAFSENRKAPESQSSSLFSGPDLGSPEWKDNTRQITSVKEKDAHRRPNPPGFSFKSRLPFGSKTMFKVDHKFSVDVTSTDGSGELHEPVRRGPLTAYGKPMSVFTADEQSILADVEPLIQSMRKIMRDSSYKDGDRLSEDDQSFVLEKIFHYHPDKASKVTGSVEFIMIDKHNIYKETRCLYVVSANGTRTDFSYLKCMENFVLEKYPETGGAFNKKYFVRRRPSNQSIPGTPVEKIHP